MNQLVLAAALAWAVVSTGVASAETLTDDSVIEMTKAGLGPDTVVAKIRTTASSFDVSTEKLIALKQAAVPDAVIAAMLTASASSHVSALATDTSDSADPLKPHASGIYLLQDGTPPRMEHLDATSSDQTKTAGIMAYALTSGIAKLKIKTVLPTPSAHVKTVARHPVFYFYFDRAQASLSGGAATGPWLPGAVTSPNEFSMVQFEVHGMDREAVLGQMNIFGAQAGVQDKARVAFTYTSVSPGVYEVVPSRELEPGEYGFLYSVMTRGAGIGGGASAKIFDFAVTKAENSDR